MCHRFNIPSLTYFATWTINSTPVLSLIQLYETCPPHKNKCLWQIALFLVSKKQITVKKAKILPAVNKRITQVQVIITAVLILSMKAAMFEHRNETDDLEFIRSFH